MYRDQPLGAAVPFACGYVKRWIEANSDRLMKSDIGLHAMADFDRHPERTLNVARTIYSRLPDDVRLWLRTREFVPVGA